MSSISTTGILSGSGIDVDSVVNQMVYAEQAPERLLQSQQLDYSTQLSTLSSIASQVSTLQSSVTSLSDILGSLATRTASSSDNSSIAANATAGAQVGQHSIVVDHIATTSSWYSQPVASPSTTLSSGTFTVQLGTGTAKSITIDSTNNTLDKLSSSINGLNLGVQANVVTDSLGARLTLVSTDTGAANDINISAASSLTFTRASTAVNASLTVDGVPLSTSSNSVSGAISGVTLTLNGPHTGSALTVAVAANTSAATSAIQQFVNNYNNVIQAVNSQFTFNSSTNQSGPLASDSALRVVQQQLLSGLAFSTKNNGPISSIAALGIGMNDDGSLTLDGSALNTALANNFSQVQTFFQAPSPNGFGASYGAMLKGLTDSTNGVLTADKNGIVATQKALGDEITDFDDRMADRRKQLITQFSKVNAILEQFPLIQSQITAQLDSLKRNS